MEEWVRKALAKWPNVPSLYGWLRLDRRGRWSIKGERIERPALEALIGRNYDRDEHGRWFFQNGPQRGFVDLEYAPLVLHAEGAALRTHHQRPVERIEAAYLDEEGSLLLVCEHGPALLAGADLEWALQRLRCRAGALAESDLEAALALPSGAATALTLQVDGQMVPVRRLDAVAAPAALGFVREPAPLGAEISCEQADARPPPG